MGRPHRRAAPVAQPPGRSGACVSFGANGSKLVTGSDDGVARVRTRPAAPPCRHSRTTRRPVGETPSRRQDAYHADRWDEGRPGRQPRGGITVHGWDAADGEMVHPWGAARVFSKSHGRWVVPINVSPDGRSARTCSLGSPSSGPPKTGRGKTPWTPGPGRTGRAAVAGLAPRRPVQPGWSAGCLRL